MKKEKIDLLVKYWGEYLKELKENNLDFKQFQYEALDNWAKENHTFLLASEMATRTPIYETQNMSSMMGFVSLNDDYLSNRANFIKRLMPSHVASFSLSYRVSNEFVLESKYTQQSCELKDTTCGLIFNHDTEGVRRLILNKIYYGVDSEYVPKYILIYFEDVTHLLKSDFFWIRVTARFEDGIEKHKVYRSDDGLIHDGDLFTDAEKMILTYLLNNNSIDEIANNLKKDKLLIDNELNNMVTRIGAKDTFSLLELCRQNGILDMD